MAGGYWYACDASVRPDALIRSWVTGLKSRHVQFRTGCRLEKVARSGQRIDGISTSEGTLHADHYVFAVGAWSPLFADQLGCRIPIQPGKGYSITMERPDPCPEHPMLFAEHRVGVSPFDDGYRLGSMMEFAGYDESISDRRINHLRRAATRYLVHPFTETVHEIWYGWRPMTWDSLPIIGRMTHLTNGLLATGHNMLGLSMAPATGRLITEILQQRPPHIDIAAFSPMRF